jgi:GT2 family glycosyltransferase
MTSVSVLIPTFRRPDSLRRCLDALKAQERAPDEVVLVVRPTDAETHELLSAYDTQSLPIKVADIEQPGQVAALNRALSAASCDIVAILDDDTAPHRPWLARIQKHFDEDPTLGGLGGRDWVYNSGRLDDGFSPIVGKVCWYGRIVGRHHLGKGAARPVDILKGANMTFRREAIKDIRFEERLKGAGVQIYNDCDFCLQLKRKGWKIVYDPDVSVDHFPADRFTNDPRHGFSYEYQRNNIHNETFAVARHIAKPILPAYFTWAVLFGTRAAPGVLQAARFTLQRDPVAVQRFVATIDGRVDGMRSYFKWRSQRPKAATMMPTEAPCTD